MDSTPSSSVAKLSSETFDEYAQKIQKAALETTRYAAYMPADVNFHRSMDADFSKDLDALSGRLLSLTNKLMSFASGADPTSASTKNYKGKAKLQTQEDVMDSFHSVVVDCMDQLLERTDICLDECLGRTRPPAIAVNLAPVTPTKLVTKTRTPLSRGHLDPVLQHASHIPKPQLSFKSKIDNSDAPWYPSLSHKYNAHVPLGYDYRDPEDAEGESIMQPHSYRYEITHFTPPSRMFVAQTPTPPPPMSSTPFTWVSTKEDFSTMLAKLRQALEIAVDLEHHSYRAYAGFVCLMQLSTREEDWIVDALELREELVELNEVFTNPDIVKVFHGADSDIIWLQQDFNLYVVNLFDTFHASRLLDFPRHGLANLLEMYCDFIPDKRYQLADWRIRPLPNEMLLYARSDTHFLLYIYDCLRNALIDRSQSRPGSHPSSPSMTPSPLADGQNSHLRSVIARSRETSLRTYQKELYDDLYGSGPNGWDTLARKWNKSLLFANNNDDIGKVQRSVYRSMHAWRDKVAREEDESVRYVLPNHHLLQIMEQPPNNLAALLNTFPSNPPPVIRKRARELLDVIREALKTTSQQDSTTKKLDTTPEIPSKKESAPAVVTTKETSVVIERDIWAAGQNAAAFKTNQSTLFERTPARAVGVLAKSHSALFGNRGTDKGLISPCFSDLVARINSTLVVAPAPTKIAPLISTLPVEPSKIEIDVTGVLGMQVEVPFVPAAQREPKIVDKRVEDTIVVVGKVGAKKRRRDAPSKDTSEQSARGSPSFMDDRAEGQGDMSQKKLPKERRSRNTTLDNKTSEEQKDFDFSAVPNVLDDPSNPTEESSRPKKVKLDKVKGRESSRKVSAAQKAHREFQGGNRSHTFKG
ncbi:hypothetical protein JOM56_010186 [Amanita muscaria]